MQRWVQTFPIPSLSRCCRTVTRNRFGKIRTRKVPEVSPHQSLSTTAWPTKVQFAGPAEAHIRPKRSVSAASGRRRET